MPDGRRTFGPVVLLGLGSAALAATASAKVWVEGSGAQGSVGAEGARATILDGVGEMPLAAALSLVVLATWGVLLVTRGVVRRVVAGLGVLAALGVLATFVTAAFAGPDDVRDAFTEAGFGQVTTAFTGWFWTAGVASSLCVVAGVAAVRFAGHWPEMGTRYDAPADAAAERDVPLEERSNLDVWKSLDEGVDPTA